MKHEYTTHSKGRRRSTKSSLSRCMSVSGKCVEWLNGVVVVGRGEVGKTQWYGELLISHLLRLCRYAIGEAPTAFSRNSFKERLSDGFPRVLALGFESRARRAHGSHAASRSPLPPFGPVLSYNDRQYSLPRSINPVRQNVSRL